jgi:hexokinase
MMKADATVFFGMSYISIQFLHTTDSEEDFLANCIGTFLKEKSIKTDGLLLGFIFPFAVKKSGLDHAILLAWSKGFQIKNAVGQDVVELFQNALDKAKVDVKCVALVNDVRASHTLLNN